MGVYLSKANTAKESDDGGDPQQNTTRFGLTAMQGWRQAMEDAHVAKPLLTDLPLTEPKEVSLYGVFDGHGGPTVSEWIARHVEKTLCQTVQQVKEEIQKLPQTPDVHGLPVDVVIMCEALQRTFLELDEAMQSDAAREEIREIFMKHEMASSARQKEEDSGADQGTTDGADGPYKALLSMSSNPRTLLQALLGGSGTRPPTIRMVEQNGEQYFQINPHSEEDEEQEDDAEKDETDKPETDKPETEADMAEEVTKTDSSKTETSRSETAMSDESATNAETAKTNETENSNDAESSTQAPTVASGQAKAIVSANEKTADEEDIAESDEAAEEETAQKDDFDHDSPASMLNRNNLPAWGPETCGAAAIVAAVVGGSNPFLITANAGDSRCVLCRKGQAIGMSLDHKPGLPEELERIHKAGGSVLAGRVDGNLNLSRTIGDLFYKTNKQLRPEEQKITAFPDVRVIPVTPDDEFVILACDGIWDCVSNDEAVHFVRERLGHDPDATQLSKICEELCDFCLAENPMHSDGGIGCDNMTCIVVLLNRRLREGASASRSDEVVMYASTIGRASVAGCHSDEASTVLPASDDPPQMQAV